MIGQSKATLYTYTLQTHHMTMAYYVSMISALPPTPPKEVAPIAVDDNSFAVGFVLIYHTYVLWTDGSCASTKDLFLKCV